MLMFSLPKIIVATLSWTNWARNREAKERPHLLKFSHFITWALKQSNDIVHPHARVCWGKSSPVRVYGTWRKHCQRNYRPIRWLLLTVILVWFGSVGMVWLLWFGWFGAIMIFWILNSMTHDLKWSAKIVWSGEDSEKEWDPSSRVKLNVAWL